MVANFSYAELRDKLQRLSRREQWLVLVVLVAGVYLLMDALVFTPQARREQALLDNQKVLQAQVTVVSAEIAALDSTKIDNLALQQVELSQLKKQASLLDSVIQSVAMDVPKIRPLMTELLGNRSSRVKTVSIKTLPVKPLLGAAKSAPAKTGDATLSAATVYKHGLDIELRGTYLDLMAFLSSLEESYPKLLWSNATLTADKYPENILRVSVFLLSTQPNL